MIIQKNNLTLKQKRPGVTVRRIFLSDLYLLNRLTIHQIRAITATTIITPTQTPTSKISPITSQEESVVIKSIKKNKKSFCIIFFTHLMQKLCHALPAGVLLAGFIEFFCWPACISSRVILWRRAQVFGGIQLFYFIADQFFNTFKFSLIFRVYKS